MRTGFFSKIKDWDESSVFEDDFDYKRFNELFIKHFDKLEKNDYFMLNNMDSSIDRNLDVPYFSESDYEIIDDIIWKHLVLPKIKIITEHRNYTKLHAPLQMLYNYLRVSIESKNKLNILKRFDKRFKKEFNIETLYFLKGRGHLFRNNEFINWLEKLDELYEERDNDKHRQRRYKTDVIQSALSFYDYNLSYKTERGKIYFGYSLSTLNKYLDKAKYNFEALKKIQYKCSRYKKDKKFRNNLERQINVNKNKVSLLKSRKMLYKDNDVISYI